MTFDFHQQLARGVKGETALDAYFGTFYHITPVTMDEQMRGIDRRFHNPRTGNRFTVEYKTDTRAAQTGNVFIETRHTDRKGWVYTAAAEWLFYYLPDAWTVYTVQFAYLRAKALPGWTMRHPTRGAPNGGYTTYGLIVPLVEFGRYASKIFDLRQELTP